MHFLPAGVSDAAKPQQIQYLKVGILHKAKIKYKIE
jgi:hypothetical protein